MKKQITRIGAADFKGSTFSHELTPVTMFAGRNFAGKSSRVEAITLALLGYIPEIGKKGTDLFENLSSGPAMAVILEMADGTHVRREWRQHKGTIKYIGSGDELDFPPVALDAQAFLSLSGPERVKFLFARTKLPADLSIEAVKASLTANVKNIKLEENTEASEEAIREVVRWITEESAETTTQGWIEELSAKAGDRKKLAAANVQRMEKTQQGLTQTADDVVAPPDTEAKLAEAQARLQEEVKAQAAREQQGISAKAELAKIEELAGSVIDESRAREEMEKLNVEIGQLDTTAINPGTVSDQEYRACSRAVMTAETDLNFAKANLTSLTTSLHKLQKDKSPKCEKCGQSIKKIVDDLIETTTAQIADAAANVDAKEKALAEATEKLTAATNAYDAAMMQKTSYDANRKRRLQAEVDIARFQTLLANNAAAMKAKQDLPTLRQSVDDFRSQWITSAENIRRLKAEVDTQNANLRLLIAQRGRAQQQAKAAQELTRARAELEVCKQACAMIGELQAKLVQTAIAPLIETANSLCGGILKHPLTYNAEKNDIGMAGKTGFWRHRSMTGTEKALAYAAISVALAADAPMRLVIIDELGRLDQYNKDMVLEALCQMVDAGQIDQAILVDTITPVFSNKNFSCIFI